MKKAKWKLLLLPLLLAAAFSLCVLYAGKGGVRAASEPAPELWFRVTQAEENYTLKLLDGAAESDVLTSSNVSDVAAKLGELSADKAASVQFDDVDVKTSGFTLPGGVCLISGKITGGAGMLAPVVEFRGEALYSTADITNIGGNASGIALLNSGGGSVILSGGRVDGGKGVAVRNNGVGSILVENNAFLTSENANADFATVLLNGGKAVINGGTVENRQAASTARIVAASGESYTVELNGGSVAFTDSENSLGTMIASLGSGEVVVNGGDLLCADGIAVNNAANGSVKVNGGTIDSGAGIAINNTGGGSVTVSERDAAVKTLIAAKRQSGTIVSSSAGASTVTVTGGRVENTSPGGAAIYTNTGEACAVAVSGGVVAAAGTAVYYGANGKLTVSGGTLEADGRAVCVARNRGSAELSGGTVTGGEAAVYNELAGEVRIAGGTLSGGVWSPAGGTVRLEGSPAITGAFHCTHLEIGENYAGGAIGLTEDESRLENGDILVYGAAAHLDKLQAEFTNGRLAANGDDAVYVIAVTLKDPADAAYAERVYATADGKYPALPDTPKKSGFTGKWTFGNHTVGGGDALHASKPHSLIVARAFSAPDLSVLTFDGMRIAERTVLNAEGFLHELKGQEGFTVAYSWLKKTGQAWVPVSDTEELLLEDNADAGSYKLVVECRYTEGGTTYTAQSEAVYGIEVELPRGVNVALTVSLSVAGAVVLSGGVFLAVWFARKKKRG